MTMKEPPHETPPRTCTYPAVRTPVALRVPAPWKEAIQLGDVELSFKVRGRGLALVVRQLPGLPPPGRSTGVNLEHASVNRVQ
jgi:hypothetical protein